MAVAAPARRAPARPAPARRAAARPATVPARPAPKRRAPARRAPAKRRRSGAKLIPLAVGRTAVAVRDFPDSPLMVRLTRGRAWIAVLGLLLAGIVGLNVLTLSYAAVEGRLSTAITALDQENSVLESRAAKRYGSERVSAEARELGLAMPTTVEPRLVVAGADAAERAARRLAAMGSG